MKFTMLLAFASLFQLQANTSYGQNQKVTLHVEEIPLTQIFHEIENQTKLNFFYNSSELDMSERVSVDVVRFDALGNLTASHIKETLTSSKQFVLPIPTQVIRGNKNVEQNPNY